MKHVHMWSRDVSKDFCTPVINEVCSGSKEGKFGGKTHAQKNFSYCSLFLRTVTTIATVRDNYRYYYDLQLQGGQDHLPCFFVSVCMVCMHMAMDALAEAGAVITNSTLIKRNFWYIISL